LLVLRCSRGGTPRGCATTNGESEMRRKHNAPGGSLPAIKMMGTASCALQTLPDGQISKTCPAHLRKIFRWSRRANQRYQLAPSFPGKRGGRASSRTLGKDAVDAAASARHLFAGRFSVSGQQRVDERRRRVRQNRVVLAPVAGVKSAEVFRRPNRARQDR
jgi:hypothetical protein